MRAFLFLLLVMLSTSITYFCSLLTRKNLSILVNFSLTGELDDVKLERMNNSLHIKSRIMFVWLRWYRRGRSVCLERVQMT